MAYDVRDPAYPQAGLTSSADPSNANPDQGLPDSTGSPFDEIPDDIQVGLKQLAEMFEEEDRWVRQRLLRKWKKNECYWNNLQHLFWSDIAGDWLSPSKEQLSALGMDGVEPEDFEKIINIYKAHGESVIAALSVQLPSINFYPDDADQPEDISTAKAFSKIAELLQKHNKAILLFVQALYYRWICGVTFAYNHYETSEDYGTVRRPQFNMVDETSNQASCPECGEPMFEEDRTCVGCGYTGNPEISQTTFKVPQLVGYSDDPKGRTVIDIFGPLHVKTGLNVRRQKDTPYLMLMFEQYAANLKNLYPWLYDRIVPDFPNKDYYDRWGRTSPQYFGYYPDNLTGVRCIWIRPWAFDYLKDKDVADRMRELWPKGCYLVKVGEELADVREEALDDHWTISRDPYSMTLHPEPLGQPIMPVQDMTNELFDLTIQTVEYGIPETFVDAEVIDLDKFEQTEIKPGMLTPAQAPAGKGMSDGFHTLQTATLSKEIEPFANRLESAAQFVSGSFPSIYGGPSQAGSKTASEYSQSRAQALQRLGPYWKSMSFFWCDAISRACREFVENMQDDEKNVVKSGTGFVNIWIKRSELMGKIGKIEPEINEDLPLTQSQKRDLLLQLFQLQSEEINAVLFSPVNSNIVKEVIGIVELNIPGEEDRNKQMEEIQELLQGQPQDPEGHQSSVPVDVEIDDHVVEAMVLRDWLVSEEGQFHKKTNPAGYMNCVAHFREHKMAEQMMAPPPPPAGAPEGGDNARGKQPNV